MALLPYQESAKFLLLKHLQSSGGNIGTIGLPIDKFII